ncbi:MAG: alpha/beta hydrolase [Roseiflexaceae bacterium]
MTNSHTGVAEVNGAQIAYEIAGEGFPLVLIHAGVADRRMWDAQMPAFAQAHRVLRYDMRGYGQTPMPAGPFAHRRDLIGLLEALGIGQAVLLGCSMGGTTAIDAALERPDLVAALIVVGSSPSGLEIEVAPPRQWDELVAAYKARDMERTAELEVEIWVDGPQRTPDQVPAAVRELVRQMNLIALTNEAAGLGQPEPMSPPAAGRLGEIRVPTLVIHGDLDQPDIPQSSAYLAEQIGGARHVVMPGTAHLPNMEQPEEFNRIVSDFLSNIAPTLR